MITKTATNDFDLVYSINGVQYVLVKRTFNTSYVDFELRKLVKKYNGIIVDNKDSGWNTGFLKMLIPSDSVVDFNKDAINY